MWGFHDGGFSWLDEFDEVALAREKYEGDKKKA